MIQRSAKRVAWLLAALAVLAGAVYGVKDDRWKSLVPDWVPWVGKDAKKAEPRTAKAALGDIEIRFKEVGSLAPKIALQVRPPINGQVKEIFVEEGDRVSKGMRLAVIQPGQTEAEQKLYLPTDVRSAIDGVVLYRTVNPGDSVQAGGDRFLKLANLDRMIAELEIGENDILKLKAGTDAAVTVDALPGESFQAKVSFISPGVIQEENQGWRRSSSKKFLVRAEIAKSDPRFKPGMTVRIDILLQKKTGVMKLPLGAVFEEMGRATAYVKKGAAVEERALKLGLRNEEEAEVLEGLKDGETVFLEKPDESMLPKKAAAVKAK